MKIIRDTKITFAVPLFLCAASALFAQSTLPATTSPAHDAGYWSTLEDRLGNEDPKIRSAAQKDLERIAIKERGKLQEILDKTTDDEVKARLAERIAEMDEQLAVDPPPITLDVKDASLSDVVHSLQTATGVNLRAWPPNDDYRHTTFTLSARDESFWEIFTKLSEQHPLSVQRSDRIQIMQQDPGMQRRIPATGGFSFFPGTIVRSRSCDLQAAPGKQVHEEQLDLQYTLAADPRIKILSNSAPILTESTDDAGNDLLTAQPGDGGMRMMNMPQSEILFNGNSQLQIPDKIGKRIATLKGSAHFLIQVSEEHLDVADPQTKLNQPLTIGDRTVTIGKFQPHDQVVDFNINANNVQRRRGPMVQPAPVHLQVLDSANQTVWETQVWGGSGGSFSAGDFKPPFKLRFSVPNKTKDLVVEFHAENLMLP